MGVRNLNAEFFPLPIDAIQCPDLRFDLYLVHQSGSIVLYRKCGTEYDSGDCEELRSRGITHLYVPNVQHQQFQAALCEHACAAFENPSLSRQERTRIVRDSCSKLIENFMSTKRVEGISDTLGVMASKFGEWCANHKSEFAYLLDMSEHDFYTTTHMVNVGVGCTLLGAEILGADHEMVHELSLGGLIHDLGKFGVPPEVLNKEGKLTDDEWDMIRKHPETGATILKVERGLSPMILDMTLHHHERLDGKGYPEGIKGDDLSLAARICGVVDVYDALTSARPYRGPIPPREVVEMMREDVPHALDAQVFSAWEQVVERMLNEDPDRSFVGSDVEPGCLSMDAMIPSPIAQGVKCETQLMIIRSNGQRIEGTLAESTSCELVVDANATFDTREKVELQGIDGKMKPAQFKCKRLNSQGASQLVFRLAS